MSWQYSMKQTIQLWSYSHLQKYTASRNSQSRLLVPSVSLRYVLLLSNTVHFCSYIDLIDGALLLWMLSVTLTGPCPQSQPVWITMNDMMETLEACRAVVPAVSCQRLYSLMMANKGWWRLLHHRLTSWAPSPLTLPKPCLYVPPELVENLQGHHKSHLSVLVGMLGALDLRPVVVSGCNSAWYWLISINLW